MLLQEHQARWANDFALIKMTIKEALIAIDIDILHIGSTSVSGLAAKPIIDIDIVYGENADFREIKNGLEKLGYYHNGNQGIADREVFKRQDLNEKHQILDFIPHHLYVCPAHSEEWRRHLAFRNYLNLHEGERKQYEKIKLKIAAEANQDRKVYASLKEIKAREFIESVLRKAAGK